MARILVVEDDAAIAELLRLYLAHAGHAVEVVGDGAIALRRFEATAAETDLVLLDLMLPGLDGRGLCRRIRAGALHPDVPIVMLTALDDDREKIEGLDRGADDYLTKPFNPAELLARVRAVLRRAAPVAPADPAAMLSLGAARLDLDARRLLVGDREVPLRTKEFELLATLAARPDAVLSRDALLARIWDDAHPVDPRTVDVHVSRLRDKLAVAGTGIAIEAVRSVGYRLAVDHRL